MRSKILLLATALFAAATLPAQVDPGAASATPGNATDPGYRLRLGDRIAVSILGEPDLAAMQIIDRNGQVRLPLVGSLNLAGHTVREAEGLIETTYRREEMLKEPQATLTVAAFAPREVTILGAVRSPGTFQFPTDTTSMDIRDLIARQGGFSPVAKGDAVAVTRKQPNGRETTTIVNVDRMMYGRSRNTENDEVFYVFPGDRIFVPERLF